MNTFSANKIILSTMKIPTSALLLFFLSSVINAYAQVNSSVKDQMAAQARDRIAAQNIEFSKQRELEDQEIKKRENEEKFPKPMCYQNICLRDSIKALKIPAINPENTKIEINSQIMQEANILFNGNSSDIEIIAKNGLVGGTNKNLSNEIVGALQKINSICAAPKTPEAYYVSVIVKLENGKNAQLVYTPMTDESGIAIFSVAAINVEYPEVQSYAEEVELAKKAQSSINIKLSCHLIGGTEYDCEDEANAQNLNINPGSMVIRISTRFRTGEYFNLENARNNKYCKKDIAF